MLAGLCLLLGSAAPLEAGVYHSKEEALAIAFPEAEVETRTFIINADQAERIEKLARAPLESRILTFYVASRGEEPLGHALIELHTVRTLPEAFMLVITPEGRIRSLFLLAFYEPEEYSPGKRWLEQFVGRGLDAQLSLKGEIHGIAGATLSSRAVTRGVRRALAAYQVLIADPTEEKP